MAKFVMAIGMSHSPMMALDGELWSEYAKGDYRHPLLYTNAGKHVTYEELAEQIGEQYTPEATQENLVQQQADMEAAFARLRRDIAEFAPDVLVVVGNDHPGELLDLANVPALAIFYGDQIISAKMTQYRLPVMSMAAKGMGMDDHHVWPGHTELATHLISDLVERGFDMGAMKYVKDPATGGHGHAWGMVVTELMPEKLIPMVPIYLNAWAPNELPPSRCYDFGRALRAAIESMPGDLRVGLVASGGLSHFVTDSDLDGRVLTALRNRDEESLRTLPRHLLQAGNSEIRNWVVLAGAVEHLNLGWDQYTPVRRTPSGTGIGMTFGRWS